MCVLIAPGPYEVNLISTYCNGGQYLHIFPNKKKVTVNTNAVHTILLVQNLPSY